MKKQEHFKKNTTKLHIGCGKDIKQGFVNLDSLNLPGVDIVHDLNKFPWPFKDNTFDYVLAVSVLEHLDNLIRTMEEIHRISKKNAIIEIRVPHFESLGAFVDPTHKIFFSYYTFDYFTKGFDYNFYSKARFEILKRRVIYNKFFFIVQWVSNLFPKFHEVILRKFFPVQDLIFKLKVIK